MNNLYKKVKNKKNMFKDKLDKLNKNAEKLNNYI